MKLFKVLLLWLAIGLPVFAQQVNVTANKIKGTGIPSGACSAQSVQLTTAGALYVCSAGTWALVTTGGAGMVIGNAVTGAAGGSWLKTNTSGNLAQTRYLDNSCYNCLAGLRLWRAALANAPQTATSVVVIGDSITQGTAATSYALSYGQQLKKWLQTKYGAGNSESLWRLASDTQTNPDPRFTLTAGTWASSATGGGMTGRNLSSTSASDTLTISTLYGDTVEVYTVNNTDTSATYCVKIDGGSCTNIAQSTTGSLATATVVRNTVSMGTLGNHTVAIVGPSSGSVYVTGVSGRIGTTGVRFYPFALSGGQSSDFSSSTDNRDQAMAAYAPGLVIIAINVNDYYFQVAKATFKTNIERIVTEAQAVSASVLILFENARGDVISGPTVLQTEYRDAAIELANTYNIAVLDIYERWGSSYSQGVTDGLIADTVHPTQKGHSDYYRALLDAVVSGDAGSNPTLAATFDGALRTVNLGTDNVRAGVYSGTPSIFLENPGVITWNLDTAGTSGGMRFIKDGASVPAELGATGDWTISGNVIASGTGNTKFNTGGGNFGIGVSGTPSGLQIGTAVGTSALSVGNVRLGLNAGTPSVFLETTAGGGSFWNIDNASGTFRFVFNSSSVPMSLTNTGLTIGSSGQELKSIFSASASLDFAQAGITACEDITMTLTGAVDGQPISIGIPHALANHNSTATFDAWRSAANTATVRRCVLLADSTNPAAATVRLTQFTH